MKKLLSNILLTVFTSIISDLQASDNFENDFEKFTSPLVAHDISIDLQGISSSTYDDDLKAKCLQFAHAQHPHFDGHLSDLHHKFLLAIFEQRIKLKIFEDIHWHEDFVISDDGELAKNSEQITFPKIKGTSFNCISEDKSTFGGGHCFEGYGCGWPSAVIYKVASHEMIPLNQNIPKSYFYGETVALNYNGNVAVYSENGIPESKLFIWKNDQRRRCPIKSIRDYYTRVKCLNNDGNIIGGSAWSANFDNDYHAFTCIDENYYYDLDTLFRTYPSEEMEDTLEDYELHSVEKISKNGKAITGILRDLRPTRNPVICPRFTLMFE